MAPSRLIPAVGDERDPTGGSVAARDERLDLRHAEVGIQSRGASTTGTDAHFHAVDTAIDQEADTVGGGDVARDQLDIAEPRPERLNRAPHHRGVSVGDVDHDDVGAGAKQFGGTFEVITLGADGGPDSEPAVIVARGKGKAFLLDQVLCRDQPEQPALRADQRKLLDLVRPHDVFRRRAHRSRPLERRGARAASCGQRRSSTGPRSAGLES